MSIPSPISGSVVNAVNGEPVAGAFVVLRGPGGEASAVSDEGGGFLIERVPRGATEIAVIADLFAPLVIPFQTDVTGSGGDSPGSRPLRVPLLLEIEPDMSDRAEVIVVTGEAPETAEPPSYDIAAEDIRVLPGSGNDALKSLQSLPGASRVPFGLGGLVLRGSSPRDSNVYLDGIEVPLLYHFGGLASFYPTSMLESLDMVPGAFGARFGRAQGGIVDLSSRRGRADRWRMSAEASLTDVSVRADGPGPVGDTWSLGLRRSYIDAVLAAAVPDDSDLQLTLAPRYYDGQLRYDRDIGASTRLSAMIFGSDDRLRFVTAPDGPTDEESRLSYTSRFIRAALRVQHRDGEFDMSVTPWVGIDESSLRVTEQGVTRESVPMGIRAEIARTLGNGLVAGGIDVQGGRFQFDINNQPPPMPGPSAGGLMDSGEDAIERDGTLWTSDLAWWLEGQYRFDDGKLGIKPGLRVERYGLTDEWVVDPRIGVSHELAEWFTLKESFGLYHQPPVFADVDPLYGNRELSSSYSVQTTVGGEFELPAGITASATGFYEEMYDLPVDVVTSATSPAESGNPLSGGVSAVSRELTSEQFGSYSYQENRGRGRAYGMEILVRASRGTPGTAGNAIGWLSYTLSRSLRRDDPARYTEYRPYVLDQPHVLTALGSLAITDKWRLGTRVRYVTGNPYTPVGGVYFDTDVQRYRSVPGEILSRRLPAFFQIDARIDRRWSGSWGMLTLFLDVQNITNRVNPEGISYNFDYSQIEYTRGLPIFPSFGLEYQP
ncbi:MAG: TonB-dependent receptor [Proteobacteria bacterium]|nr:TonB-dependent receptor [Pseudomonadota bacterium]